MIQDRECLLKALQWDPLFSEDSGVVCNGDFILVANTSIEELDMLRNRNGVTFNKRDIESIKDITSIDDISMIKKPVYRDFTPIGQRGFDWYLQYKGLLIDSGQFADNSVEEVCSRVKFYTSKSAEELALLAKRSFRCYNVLSHKIAVPTDNEESRVFGNCGRCGEVIILSKDTYGEIFNFQDGSNFEKVSIDFKPGIVYHWDDYGTDGLAYANGNPYCRFIPYDKRLNRLNTRGQEVYLPYIVFMTLLKQGDIQRLSIEVEDYTEEFSFYDNLCNDFYRVVSSHMQDLDPEIIMNLKRVFYNDHLDVTQLFSNNVNIEAIDVYSSFIRNNYSVDDLLIKRFDRCVLKQLLAVRRTDISPYQFTKKKKLNTEILQYELNSINDNLMYTNDELFNEGYTHEQLAYINYLITNGEEYRYLSKGRPVNTYPLYRILHNDLPMSNIADYLLTRGVTGEKMQSVLWMNVDPEIKGSIHGIFGSFPDIDLNGIRLQDLFNKILYNTVGGKFQVISLGYIQSYGFVLYSPNGKYIQFSENSIGIFDQKNGPLWRVIKVGEKSLSSINDGTVIIDKLSE